jgi:hypothetical protein
MWGVGREGERGRGGECIISSILNPKSKIQNPKSPDPSIESTPNKAKLK